MKYLKILFLYTFFICIVLFFRVSNSLSSTNQVYRSWYCYQLGQVRNIPAQYISKIYVDNIENHFNIREQLFAKAVKKNNKHFIPLYDAKCVSYLSRKEANKTRIDKIMRAYKWNYRNYEINFKFDTNKIGVNNEE